MTGKWWTKSWQVTLGCEHASPGCAHCYAERYARRLAGAADAARVAGRGAHRGEQYKRVVGPGGWTGEILTLPESLHEPLHWRNPGRVFLDSMGDLFHPAVPFDWIDRVFAAMAVCPQHTFFVLTKRPQRMLEYLTTPGRAGRIAAEDPCYGGGEKRGSPGRTLRADALLPLDHVLLGITAEDQERYDERWPYLAQLAAVGWHLWISAEPLLGPVDVRTSLPIPQEELCDQADPEMRREWSFPRRFGERIDWLVVGGETGPGARPCHPDWVRDLRDWSQRAGVPFWVKQLGEWRPVRNDEVELDGVYRGQRDCVQVDARAECGYYCDSSVGHVDHGSTQMIRVGARATGRVLNGWTWQHLPARCA